MSWKWKKDQMAKRSEKEREKVEELRRDKMRIEYDTVRWKNSKTGSVIGVDDFRFAELFALTKMRYGHRS